MQTLYAIDRARTELHISQNLGWALVLKDGSRIFVAAGVEAGNGTVLGAEVLELLPGQWRHPKMPFVAENGGHVDGHDDFQQNRLEIPRSHIAAVVHK